MCARDRTKRGGKGQERKRGKRGAGRRRGEESDGLDPIIDSQFSIVSSVNVPYSIDEYQNRYCVVRMDQISRVYKASIQNSTTTSILFKFILR